MTTGTSKKVQKPISSYLLMCNRSVWKGNGQEKSMEKQKFGKQEHQKLAAQWAKLLDSEKEPFKQKTVMEKVEYEKIKRELECENGGGKNKVLLTRCSPICLLKLFKDFKDKKIDTILHSINMGSLLQMKSRSMRREVIIYLIERFNAESCAIKVDGHNITHC
ncbi:hypothetical protein Golob_016791 [Gossypium lobatum]|uniref:HMG box domain-containing protein n=1 Tax=Gossypium lobatum TaxID=34289 RepID=A0A7J8M580_9ROSI|nr:hypothetical protein [Gossypium lobatum]